jgi:hypothetical protein
MAPLCATGAASFHDVPLMPHSYGIGRSEYVGVAVAVWLLEERSTPRRARAFTVLLVTITNYRI